MLNTEGQLPVSVDQLQVTVEQLLTPNLEVFETLFPLLSVLLSVTTLILEETVSYDHHCNCIYLSSPYITVSPRHQLTSFWRDNVVKSCQSLYSGEGTTPIVDPTKCEEFPLDVAADLHRRWAARLNMDRSFPLPTPTVDDTLNILLENMTFSEAKASGVLPELIAQAKGDVKKERAKENVKAMEKKVAPKAEKSLGDFPPELLDKIFKLVGNAQAADAQEGKACLLDLVHLRLVCKKFRAVVRSLILAEIKAIPDFALKFWDRPKYDWRVVFDPEVNSSPFPKQKSNQCLF